MLPLESKSGTSMQRLPTSTRMRVLPKGREFVEAYVAYTHYVERLHQDATAKESAHGEHGKVEKHNAHKKESAHSKH